MDFEKTCRFIETSFLRPLLENPNVTDISYNGVSIFYMDNINGRLMSDIKIDTLQAKDFIRQIANLCEKQFSYQNPKLDVSVGRYRINAVHQSIAKKGNADVINFCLRIASSKLHISKESGFLTDELDELLTFILLAKNSIVIGGQTGSGKTEFQKFLLTKMEENTRIIVVDNVLELDYVELNPKIDLNIWQADEEKPQNTIQQLIKNALRSNPDWLIAAEARGEEMVDVLNSALTGHPIITTIHAFDCESMPTRMTRMVMMGNKKANYEDIYEDISYHLRIYVYLKRRIQKDGKVVRYINEINYLERDTWKPIYKYDNGHQYFKFDREMIRFLQIENPSEKFSQAFLGGNL